MQNGTAVLEQESEIITSGIATEAKGIATEVKAHPLVQRLMETIKEAYFHQYGNIKATMRENATELWDLFQDSNLDARQILAPLFKDPDFIKSNAITLVKGDDNKKRITVGIQKLPCYLLLEACLKELHLIKKPLPMGGENGLRAQPLEDVLDAFYDYKLPITNPKPEEEKAVNLIINHLSQAEREARQSVRKSIEIARRTSRASQRDSRPPSKMQTIFAKTKMAVIRFDRKKMILRAGWFALGALATSAFFGLRGSARSVNAIPLRPGARISSAAAPKKFMPTSASPIQSRKPAPKTVIAAARPSSVGVSTMQPKGAAAKTKTAAPKRTAFYPDSHTPTHKISPELNNFLKGTLCAPFEYDSKNQIIQCNGNKFIVKESDDPKANSSCIIPPHSGDKYLSNPSNEYLFIMAKNLGNPFWKSFSATVLCGLESSVPEVTLKPTVKREADTAIIKKYVKPVAIKLGLEVLTRDGWHLSTSSLPKHRRIASLSPQVKRDVALVDRLVDNAFNVQMPKPFQPRLST